MPLEIDIGQNIQRFAEEITLYRYSVEYDDSGHRYIDEDNPDIYTLRASVQQLDAEVEWLPEGTTISEFRTVYLEFPYKTPLGDELDLQIRTRVRQDEEDPVDGAMYRGQHYDFVEKLADYTQYGYEKFIIQFIE